MSIGASISPMPDPYGKNFGRPTLADFLCARFAEDEEAAIDAGIDFYNASAPEVPKNVIDHIARHNPVRVADECEAKRQILMQVTQLLQVKPGGPAYMFILKQLASPYTDHPDYREEWRA